MMLSINPIFPLDPITLAILSSIDKNAKILNIDYFVIGAMAREIIVQHVFGIGTIRATRDIDFAIAVGNWEMFEKFKIQLLQEDSGFTSGNKEEPYRLLYSMDSNSEKLFRPVDILPFGGIESYSHSILWPPDLNIIMSVMGFVDASKATVMVKADSSLTIPVASIPGLAMLKLISWSERTGNNRKDAQDFSLFLHNYADLGNMERLYGEELRILEVVKFDTEKAGARLLGKDVASIASNIAKEKIKNIFLSEKNNDLIIIHMAIGNYLDEAKIENTIALLEEFKSGFGNDLIL